MALLLLIGRAAVTVRDADISDFRCFYEAGRLVRLGEDPYDSATWARAVYTDPTRVPHCAASFIYPLWTALALAPLTLLPEPSALAVWECLSIAGAVGGAVLLARTRRPLGGERLFVMMVVSSQPLFSAVANAQFGAVVFGLLAVLSYGLERGRSRLTAATWVALLIKPHLSALVLAGTLALDRGRWRGLAIAAGVAVTLASLVLLRLWPIEYVWAVVEQRLDVDPGLASFATLAHAYGLPSASGAVLGIAAAIAFLYAIRGTRPGPAGIVACAVAATLLATPYARPHDLVVLAVPLCVSLARGTTADVPTRRLLLAAAVFALVVLPWSITIATLAGLPLAWHVAIAVGVATLTAYAMRSTRAARLG